MDCCFWQFGWKKFAKYAVEAGDGTKFHIFNWNIFANGIELAKIMKI